MHSRGVKVCRRRKTDEGEPKKEKGEARGGGVRSGGLWGVDGPLSCRPLVMSYYLACPPSSCSRPSPRVALRVFSPSTHFAPLPFHCGVGSTGRGGAGLLTDDFEQETKRYAALKPGGMNGHQCRCTACMAFVLVPHLRKRAAPYRFLALCRDFALLLVVLFPAFVALSLPALSIISLPLVALRFVSLPSRAHWPMPTLRTSFFWGFLLFSPLLQRCLARSRPPPFLSVLFDIVMLALRCVSLPPLRFPLLLMGVRSATDSRRAPSSLVSR